MRTATINAAELTGIEATPVNVECTIGPGAPSFMITGLPDTTVLESRQRVRAALLAQGFSFPREQISINLSPASLRKTGTSYDLPIAVAILAATGQIPAEGLDRYLFAGELQLSGEPRTSRGDMARAVLARNCGLVPVVAKNSMLLSSIKAKCCPALSELRYGADFLERHTVFPPENAAEEPIPDFADIAGYDSVKRAAIISAAGKHNILLIGPKGTPVASFARRLPTIFPALSDEELEQAMLIRTSCSWVADAKDINDRSRPFRAPHHSISIAGLIGGGRPILPGEMSLAHGGVLFLDEIDEFSPAALASMRPAIESREVAITRQESTVSFPADTVLVGAAASCPCGNLGHPHKPCIDSVERIDAYQTALGKASAGLFDMQVPLPYQAVEMADTAVRTMASDEMRDRVCAAAEFALWRKEKAFATAQEEIAAAETPYPLAKTTLSVARTIADLELSGQIRPEHIREARALTLAVIPSDPFLALGEEPEMDAQARLERCEALADETHYPDDRAFEHDDR